MANDMPASAVHFASKRRPYSVLILLLWFALVLPAFATPLRVGVMTMQPGEIFWERFGHNAIVVDDGKKAISYNFGFFDPSETDFVGNFIQGRMNYVLAALPLQDDLVYYRKSGRGVAIQWLNLNPPQSKAIAERLEFLARPENARYRYDYFTNNCATQVRDVLDAALNGRLRGPMSASSLGNSYRSETVRLAWPAKWMALGFDLGLGRPADKPLSRWQEAFIPMNLAASLSTITLPDGRALVAFEQTILPHRLAKPPVELPQWPLTALFVGAAMALGFKAANRYGRKTANALMLAFWSLAGLFGSVMALLWLFSAHRFAYANENLLLLSPLAGLLPVLFMLRRQPHWQRPYVLGVKAVALMAVTAAALKLLGFSTQNNMNWLVLALPLHAVVCRHALQDMAQKTAQ
jgi:Domain of unknown function (DUF4105)